MIVRAATRADLDALRAIARPFFARSHYATMGVMRDEATEALLAALLAAGIFLVAELDGAVVGMLGALIVPLLMDGLVFGASEIVFFVREDLRAARGAGRHLLAALEADAVARGLAFVQMHSIASSPNALLALYRKQGYSLTEASFTKVL